MKIPGENSELRARATEWASGALESVQASAARKLAGSGGPELARFFADPLTFGTAGLRGPVGPGPGGMNENTVAQVSYGLARFVLEARLESRPVLVGYDARPESRAFARRCASVLSGQGLSVLLMAEPAPTPLVPFGVRSLSAAAGVVVTASHNPRGDNGFKVYDDRGVQIVSPWDTRIADFMTECPNVSELPLSDACSSPDDELFANYRRYLRAMAHRAAGSRDEAPGKSLQIAYSPLHGVGQKWVKQALNDSCSQIELLEVSKQSEPDGTFPTLPFPNPEEPGALDLLLACAKEAGADAAFANDPDADRFSLSLPISEEESEEWITLSGDELGILFADECLRWVDRPALVVSTVVSSPQLEALAKARKAEHKKTLTGFKWLCRPALEDLSFVFAYEEAIGFCFSAPSQFSGVFDKDGIAAALVAATLLKRAGSGPGLLRRLDEIHREVGFWASFGRSRRFVGQEGQCEMTGFLQRLRERPPTTWTGLNVELRRDYLHGAEDRPLYLGAQDLLEYKLRGDGLHGVLMLRPSGTEPKLKLYIHLSPSRTAGDFRYERVRMATVADELAAAVFEER